MRPQVCNEQQNQADGVFWCKVALTNAIYLANTSRHENIDRSYCGGYAHGQDGVTIRRQPPMRGKTGSSRGLFLCLQSGSEEPPVKIQQRMDQDNDGQQ
jgi:hypothetical protein